MQNENFEGTGDPVVPPPTKPPIPPGLTDLPSAQPEIDPYETEAENEKQAADAND